MEQELGGNKKSNSIMKKFERYLSSPDKRTSKQPLMKTSKKMLDKSRSWHPSSLSGRGSSAPSPKGCFSVYVGPDKQRFSIKAEFANHHLFKMLLEDAEMEYGFTSGGPLLIPCDVESFCKVLADIDGGDQLNEDGARASGSTSSFMARARSSFDYGVLPQSRSLKINKFYA